MQPDPLDPSIAPALLQAYRETHFEVHEGLGLSLRTGQPNHALQQLQQDHGVRCSAFVTACNPRSEPLPDRENDRRHAALREQVGSMGLTCFEGAGRHPSNSWPPERSLLVLGLDLAAARQLGARWGQNAIVWSGADAVPQLVLIAERSGESRARPTPQPEPPTNERP